MKRYTWLVMFLCFLGTFHPSYGQMVPSSSPLSTASFWIDQGEDNNTPVLTEKEIEAYQNRIYQQSPSVPNLSQFPSTIQKETVLHWLDTSYLWESTLYTKGQLLSEAQREQLLQEENLSAIADVIPVRYGLTVQRASLRVLPSWDGLYSTAELEEFDRLQNTTLHPGEPVLILHESASSSFYFVQARNYRGWIDKNYVGETDRKTWLSFLQPSHPLVFLSKQYDLPLENGPTQQYQQGAILPIIGEIQGYYRVSVPTRTDEGKIELTTVPIYKEDGIVHNGYVPYTKEEILKQAFAFYGSPYGWGGLKNSVDCSSLIESAYRTVGIYLPRDADEQEKTAGYSLSFAGLSPKERLHLLATLPVPTPVFMDGHVLLYIGFYKGHPYFIHSLASYVEKDGQGLSPMAVVVSDEDLYRGNGQSFLSSFTSALIIK